MDWFSTALEATGPTPIGERNGAAGGIDSERRLRIGVRLIDSLHSVTARSLAWWDVEVAGHGVGRTAEEGRSYAGVCLPLRFTA